MDWAEVVICANIEKRKHILSRLKENVVIIACYDLLNNSAKTEFQDFLDSAERNLIIIAADEEQNKFLREYDFHGVRIVVFDRYCNTTLKNPVSKMDTINEINCLLFGMSHSQCAIDENLLGGTYYKIASPSMDLFCHLGFLKKVIEQRPSLCKEIQNIIIEVPYYIFNYDLSSFGNFTLTKLNYFYILKNYHNFKDDEKINEWELFTELFMEDDFEANIIQTTNSLGKILRKILKYPIWIIRIAKLHDKVWERQYLKTMEENKELFKEFISVAKNKFPDVKITILIMPFNPIFRWTHIRTIEEKKKSFYNIINSIDSEIMVIDDFTFFKRSRYFDDHCHLNKKGGKIYTVYLKKILEKTRTN